jgi:hypothetical protein
LDIGMRFELWGDGLSYGAVAAVALPTDLIERPAAWAPGFDEAHDPRIGFLGREGRCAPGTVVGLRVTLAAGVACGFPFQYTHGSNLLMGLVGAPGVQSLRDLAGCS